MKEFYEGLILINIGTFYLLVFQYFSHGLLFLETSHTTFPTKVIVQMRQDNAFSLENVYFKTYEVPMSNDYTCASVNLKHFSVR